MIDEDEVTTIENEEEVSLEDEVSTSVETGENDEDNTVTLSPTEVMIDQIAAGDLVHAEVSYTDLINSKVDDALESEKLAIADTMFNSSDEEGEVEIDVNDILGDDLDDIEAMVDETDIEVETETS
jgi:hypothetical protein